ncbi:MAG: FAD-binding oxidoreductase [Gammaproteobacteria bacterium]
MHWITFPLRLESARMVTPSILHLEFRRADGEAFEFVPGQFINIHFEHDGQPVHRSYSVANSPEGSDTIQIAVSPVQEGRATRLLFGLKPGDEVAGSGPYGRFVLRDDPPCRYVLAGTGTGVTPYRAMLPELERRLDTGDYSADLLLGVWSPDELLYGSDFLAVAERCEKFRFHACYSRAEPADPQPFETRGYVQSRFGSLDLDPESDIVYLCGNPDMIDEAMVFLKARGFPTARLRREKYLSARS